MMNCLNNINLINLVKTTSKHFDENKNKIDVNNINSNDNILKFIV